jgi:hypothetical protein
MADAVASIVGGALMVAFLMIIATTLNELPVWIVFIVGIVLMMWGFWTDVFAPLRRRDHSKS